MKTIIRNVASVYGKLFVSSILLAASIRLVLTALGPKEFGVYTTLVGFTFLIFLVGNSISSGVTRELAYSLAACDDARQNRVMRMSVISHWALTLFFMLIAEPFGYWYTPSLDPFVTPGSAPVFIAYQFVLMAGAVALITEPYHALLTAKEDFLLTSATAVARAAALLLLAFSLHYVDHDRLLVYSIGGAFISIAISVIEYMYTRKTYLRGREIHDGAFEPALARQLFAFSGWNLLGSVAVGARAQGVLLVITHMLGPIAAGGFGIANQLVTILTQFNQAITSVMAPRLVKIGANGRVADVNATVLIMCRLCLVIALALAAPLLAETDDLLSAWLHSPPTSAGVFCWALLLMYLLDTSSAAVSVAIQASGRIARLQVICGLINLSTVPAVAVAAFFHTPLALVLAPLVVAAALITMFRLLIFAQMRHHIVRTWTFEVAVPGLACLLAVFALGFIRPYGDSDILVVLANCAAVSCLVVAAWGVFGVSTTERRLLWAFIVPRLLPGFARR